MVNEPHNYVRATPRDYQVIDIFSPSELTLVATIAQVKHIGLPCFQFGPGVDNLVEYETRLNFALPNYDHPTEWALI
jgi:hypothetical protein